VGWLGVALGSNRHPSFFKKILILIFFGPPVKPPQTNWVAGKPPMGSPATPVIFLKFYFNFLLFLISFHLKN
jgi:hypothetical protein